MSPIGQLEDETGSDKGADEPIGITLFAEPCSRRCLESQNRVGGNRDPIGRDGGGRHGGGGPGAQGKQPERRQDGSQPARHQPLASAGPDGAATGTPPLRRTISRLSGLHPWPNPSPRPKSANPAKTQSST